MGDTTVVQHGGGWFTNIGNAFIDLGSIYSLEEAVADCNVQLTSSFGAWIFSQMRRGVSDLLLHDLADNNNAINPADLNNVDYFVQSGTCLADHWFDVYGDALFRAKAGGAEIVLNGVGLTDDSYSEPGIERARDRLKELEPHAVISRDQRTYEHFKDIAPHTYNGIDCGFFVSDTFKPMNLDEEFVVLNYDKRPEPTNLKIGEPQENRVVRTHHSFWLNFSPLEYPTMREEYYGKRNTIISELPYDYLNVYGNTNGTYSDRVHACVGSIAYGNPAYLDHETPRSLLFERVGMGAITEGLYDPTLDALEEEKENQIEFLAEIL